MHIVNKNFLNFITFLLFSDSKDATLFYLIHGVLKPNKILKDTGKPTIGESQKAVIKFIEGEVQADLYTGEAPLILVKNNIFSIEKIWVITRLAR